jgi:cell division septum initiation protein DivIVA
VSESTVFSYTRKGYAPEQVDAEYASLSEELDNLKRSNQDSVVTLARLKRELAEARAQLRQTGGEVSFKSLGTDLAKTLKIAQDRAVDLVQAAEQDTAKLLSSTKAEAKEIVDAAKKHADQIVKETKRETERALLQTQKRSESLILEAEEALQLAKSRADVSRGQILVIEKETRARLAKINQDTERERAASERAIANLNREIEEEIVKLDAELEIARKNSAEAMTIADEETNVYVQEKAREGVAVTEEAERKYTEIVIASEAQSTRLLVEADNILRDARKLAEILRASILTRVRVVKGKVAEHARELTSATTLELAETARRQQAFADLNSDLNLISEAATSLPSGSSTLNRRS